MCVDNEVTEKCSKNIRLFYELYSITFFTLKTLLESPFTYLDLLLGYELVLFSTKDIYLKRLNLLQFSPNGQTPLSDFL